MIRLGVFSTHPIQYQVPIWRDLTNSDKIDLSVFYFSEQGVSGAVDEGFGKSVVWDVPLLEGYSSKFLSRESIESANSFRITDPEQLLSEADFDVVLLHGYTHRFARQLIRLRRRFGYRVVLRGEFTEMPRRRVGLRSVARWLYLKWFYRQVDHFCPIGKDAIDHLERYGIEHQRYTLAPYSVDDRLINRGLAEFSRAFSRENLDIPDDHVVFLFSGKMIPRKQPLLLAEALLELSREYEKFSAIFLGSGEQYDSLVELLSEVNSNRFLTPGFVNQSELGLFFTAADVLVLPSLYDTWGLVVNEAMHYGLPCLVSDKVGAGRDLVVPGVTGDVFESSSRRHLTAALRKVLEAPETLEEMSNNVQSVISAYTIEATLEGITSAVIKAVDK